jgi:outer membrane cobalamin receptor
LTAVLDPLQVTQTKRPARKTPAGTLVLTAADLERGHYRSLADALEDCPGITIGRTGYGDGEQRIHPH